MNEVYQQTELPALPGVEYFVRRAADQTSTDHTLLD